MSEFVLQIPLHVVEDSGTPLTGKTPSRKSVLCMYTESLHAERARDEQRPTGTIVTLLDVDKLVEYVEPLEVTHVAIDTREQTGSGGFVISKEDFITELRNQR